MSVYGGIRAAALQALYPPGSSGAPLSPVEEAEAVFQALRARGAEAGGDESVAAWAHEYGPTLLSALRAAALRPAPAVPALPGDVTGIRPLEPPLPDSVHYPGSPPGVHPIEVTFRVTDPDAQRLCIYAMFPGLEEEEEEEDDRE